MKKSKKGMALILALSMVVMSGTLAFADVEADPATGTDNTANADMSVETPAEEETKAAADVPDENTEGETGEEAEEVCEHELEFVRFILPTCTEEGKAVFKCKTCGATIEEKNSEPYGHQMKVVDVQKPTATDEGKSISKCTVCGYTETKPIPAIEEETNVTVTVRIQIYDAKKTQYGVYGLGELKKKITVADMAESYENYSLDITEILRKQTDLNGQLGEGITVNQLRAVNCKIRAGQYSNLQLVLDDADNFQKQSIEGFAGTDGVTIDIEARPWYNFTQIYYYLEQLDGTYAYFEHASKETLLNTQVEYKPEPTAEKVDGYEYAGYDIGYFHNPNSLTPDQIRIKDDLAAWGLTADDQGKITGPNINFYADDQLYILYMYAKIYNIDYNLAGGNVNGATTIETQKAKRSATVSLISNPTRAGYTFKGWTITVDDEQITAPEISADGKFTMPAANVSLTANWEPAPYIPPYNPPTPDPTPTPDPVNPQPLPPDDPLIEDPDKPIVEPQPLPPDDPLEDPSKDLPDDEYLQEADADKNPKQPKTGDEAPLLPLCGLLLVSAGALGAIYIKRKKD